MYLNRYMLQLLGNLIELYFRALRSGYEEYI